MAKKNDNTLLWVAALGIGGYFLYKNWQSPAATAVSNTAANASSGTLQLNPAPGINTNAPVTALPVTSSPNSFAINTTGLVPATTNNQGVPVLQPGQTLAVGPNNLPVTNSAGVPLVFASSMPANYVLKNQLLSGTNDYLEHGECL